MNCKTFALAVVFSLSAACASAEEKEAVFDKPKFSGYIIGQYQANIQEGNTNKKQAKNIAQKMTERKGGL